MYSSMPRGTGCLGKGYRVCHERQQLQDKFSGTKVTVYLYVIHDALVLYISLLHAFYKLSGINFYRWLLREFHEMSRTNSGR